METVSEAQDDSSGANPSSVKSEDGSPPPDGRSSPPPNCAICLGRCRNKSFTDSCLHQFCFKCLLTWSKVKTECPLCKQNFKSIIHNVQSNQQYEEYQVDQRRHEEDRIDINDIVTATRRFRYRTTLTFPRGGEHIALHRLLLRYPPLSAMVGMSNELPTVTPAALPSSRRRQSPTEFRRIVYRRNLWARPLPDFTGRHRDCTPDFYRYNENQMHRLVPWLNRELHYLLNENTGHIAYVLQRILELLPQNHITSPEFRDEMYRYLGNRTDHFLHELHCYASTPYDLTGYDRSVQYTTEDSRAYVNTINDISSSDSDSADSDVVEVLDASLNRQPSTPPVYPVIPPDFTMMPSSYTDAGPANRRLPDPVYPLNLITSPTIVNLATNNVIPIETISNSDTDDDEVMVTGYIKPPHQRTPEVVDLRDSDNDSDVVVTEAPAPPPQRFPVKLTISRPRAATPSDSDNESYTPPRDRISEHRIEMPRSSSDSGKSVRSSQLSSDYSSSYASSSTSGDDEIPKRNKSDRVRPRKRSLKARCSRRTQRQSRENNRNDNNISAPMGSPSPSTSAAIPMPSSSASISEPSTSAGVHPRSTSDRDHRNTRDLGKSNSGKGVKSSRRTESVIKSRTPEPMEVDQSLVESRVRDVGESSRQNDKSVKERVNSEKEVRNEPLPGPSSRPDTVSESSRTDLLTKSDTSRKEKNPPTNPAERKRESHHSQSKKERKHKRQNEDSPKFKDEPQPGPSRPDDKIKSSRRGDPSESTNDSRINRNETVSSYSKNKHSRRDECSSSTSSKSSERANYRRDEPDTATTSIVASDPLPETSRHSGKEVALSMVKESKSSREKSHHSDRSSESRKSPSDVRAGPSQGESSRREKRKHSDELPRHENKRLKSVVKKASGSSSSAPLSSVVKVTTTSAKIPLSSDSFSDSDDDIPLNLTIHRGGNH